MPKLAITEDNQRRSAFDFNGLKLEHGETARIVAIEKEPEYSYVHTLRAPTIVDGRPVFRKASNSEREEMVYEFVGRHLCLGDLNVLSEKGKDTTNCPTCRASEEGTAVRAPERRFAMHIIRYKTQPGTFSVQEPFSAELLVWSFPDKVFDTLVALLKEWGPLQQRDLCLGPCENKMFQKFDIRVGSSCEWVQTKERQEYIATVYKNNLVQDLTVAIGRRLSADQIQDDLETVLARHSISLGRTQERTAAAAPQIDASDILGIGGPAASVAPPVPSPVEPAAQVAPVPVGGGVGLGQFAPATASAPPAPPVPATPTTPPPTAAGKGVKDLEKLLEM